MTLIDTGLSPVERAGPGPVIAEVDGVPVSGLLAEVPAPRAVLLALHGDSTSSIYFDCPGHPDHSLLRLGQLLGYTVLALDRPGYGASAPYAAASAPPARRVELMFGALDALVDPRARGAGVFLIGHSAGCELALRMAADDRQAGLLGLELAGTGLRHPDFARDTLWSSRTGEFVRPPGLADLLWRPERLYPPDVVYGASIAAPGVRLEADGLLDWTERGFPHLAGRVRVPVRLTLGDHERVWRNGHADLADVGAHFRAAPRVLLNRQTDTGHNLSVGYTAPAYHLKLLAFAEECLLARAHSEFSAPAVQFDGCERARPYETEDQR